MISVLQENVCRLEKSEKIDLTRGFMETIQKTERSRNVFIKSMICESTKPSGTGNCV